MSSWAGSAWRELGALAGADVRPDGDALAAWVSLADGAPCRWRFLFDGGEAALAAGARFAEVQLVADMAGEGDDSPSRLLDRVRVKTVGHSPARTRERLEKAALGMPRRVAAAMLAGHSPATGKTPGLPAGSRPDAFSLARNLAARVWRERIEEHWTIGWREGAWTGPLDGASTPADVDGWRWLPEREGGYLADPFAIEVEGRVWLFAEAYDFATRKGYIVAGKLDDALAGSRLDVVMQAPWHLSWPNMFEASGRIWMLPEAAGGGSIRLHVCERFPDRWREAAILVEDFAGADPTLHFDGELWWLFATDAADQAESVLHLFSSTSLTGPFRPHPLNPVKVDIASARPAGPLFRHRGDLIRPVQDCRQGYGGAVVFNRIEHLSPTAFVERDIGTLQPDPASLHPSGLHSFTRMSAGTLIDIKRERPSLSRLYHALRP
ncbi:MAG: hypothetical protein R3C97_01135 [Geminicoccaceae bacterium]